jgi:two-component system sensor histidine kinase/response regulator
MQMPVMDGLQATEKIRSRRACANLPIVAMTANAMQQDRDRCIASGMNDFLAKPIEVEELWTVLRRWIKPRKAATTTAPSAAAPPAPTPSAAAPSLASSPARARNAEALPLDVEGLDVEVGLRRVLGNVATYRSLLQRFVAGQAGAVDEIRLALANHDPARAERLAHTLKGLAGTIGAAGVQVLAKEVEASLRERAVPSVLHERLVPLSAALDHLVSDLAARLSPDQPAPAATTVDRARVADVCGALDRLLADSDMDASALLKANAPLLRGAFGPAFARLEALVQSIEFEEARVVLGELTGAS